MRFRVVRLLAISAIALLLLIIVGLIALHTNPVQSRILQWSVGELERRFDLDLVADDLHFNLLSRRVVMTNVRLAAVGHHDEPFFTAETVTVKLPWAAYRGRLQFDEVSVDTGSVSIARDTSGVSNLPPGRGRRDPNAPPRRVDVRGLVVRNLDFLYRDFQRDVEIRTPQIRTDLAYETGKGASGPFAIDGDLLVRVRERSVAVKPIAGRMVFDGSNVELADMRLDAPEGSFAVAGKIERALDRPTLDLTIKGTADIAQGSRWAPPPIHVAGQATIEATMKGAPSEFVLDSRVVAKNAEVGTERGVGIDAESRLTPNGIAVSRSTITPPTGGEIHATVDVPFGSQVPWWIEADWTGLDAASAFRLAEVRVLPFGAALTGKARIDRAPGEPFQLRATNVSTARSARGTAPLSGEVEFSIAGSRWSAKQRHRMGATAVNGPIGGVWNRQAASRSTFEGAVTVDSGNIGEAARYAALFGFSTPSIVTGASGPLAANVTLGGIFTEPTFTGTASSSAAIVPSIGTVAFSANFDASARALNATGINATIDSSTALGSGSAELTGDVFADLVSRKLAGELRIDAPSAADLLSALPAALRLEGPLAATTVFGGTVDKPDITADITGTGLTLGGQPIESLVAKARVIDGGVNVESLSLKQATGELRATGRYMWETRTYTVDVNGQGLTWRGPIARVGDAEARFALKFSGAGSIDKPTGEGVLEFNVAGGVAGELINRGVANVRLNGETALVTAQIPSLGAFISANVVPRAPFSYDSVVVMNRIDLAPVVTLAGLEHGHVTGTASLSATAAGDLSAPTKSQAFVNLQDIQADVSDVPVRLAAPSRLSWDGSGLTIDTLDVTVGQGRLAASGRLGEGGLSTARWETTFKGELGDLLKIGRPFGVPAALQGGGPVDFNWRSTGGLDQSTANVQVSGGIIQWGALPAVADLEVDANFNGKTLELSRLTGQWQGGGIEGTASIPRAVLEGRDTGGAPLSPQEAGFAKIEVTGLTEGALAPWLDSNTLAAITGRVSATLDARITRPSLEGVTGTLTLGEADFTLAGVKVSQIRPSTLSIDGGLMTARDVAFNAGGSPLTVTGTARLAPTDKQALDLQVQGTADLQIISAFAPTLATGGDAKINIGIGGPPSAPVFSGRVDVVDAEIAIREPRVVVSELNGTIALDGQRVIFDGLTGSANGGPLTLDGGFLLRGFTPIAGGLTVQMQRAAFEYPEGLQTEVDALVTLAPGNNGWSLVGDVRVERGVYNETISLPALIAARRIRAPSAGSGESWADRLRLNLSVVTQQDLRLDNNYGRLEAGAAVTVLGTARQPAMSGRITLREGGEVYLGGNTFHVSRGSISFTNPYRIVPEFDIELRTQVSGSDLTLTLEGPLDRLETEVRSSDPSVDSREAMSMLFGGFQGEDAVALLSAELLGATGRAIGLDTLRVERGFDNDEFRADPGLIATETDPSTRLTLSKRLRPDVELILSQSLRESGGLSAIVSYKPRRNIEIRGVSRDNLDRSLALRHEITFGGAGTTTGSDSTTQPKVAAVTISGAPGRPVDELMALLDHKPGDTFDFHKWQKDIDALRASYHERGYYEARIRGARQVSDDGLSVALDYPIEPGPLAELVIEGHPLEPEVEREIRDAWMRTIFDRFLLEDIRARISRHLIEENVIGSTVDAQIITATPERKQVRVTVTAGTQVSRREIAYRGNTAFDADRLNSVVQEAGLAVDGWLDPPQVAEALAGFYRDEGYLGVSVKAEPARVQGSLGVLLATIEEGRRFSIGSVSFAGVSPNLLPSIASAARLDSGMPFVTAEIEAARGHVEEFYAREGFNSVQIEVESIPRFDAGAVDLRFAILEGTRQVLREVTTEGATRTREGVITRTLRLRIDEPVNLATWSQARKRLYDTNVFRQVDIEAVPLEPTTEDSAAGIQPVRAVVRVAEYPQWRLRYGLQLNDEKTDVTAAPGEARQQNLGVLADLQNQNVFGLAITAGIAGRYERDRQAASLFTSNGSFFGLPIRSNGFIFGSRQRFDVNENLSTIDERIGLSAEQRWRPFRLSEVIWSYRFERSHVFDPDPSPDEDFPFDATASLSKVNLAVVLDRRDDPVDPKRGWFAAANIEQALRILDADGSGKLLVQQSLYREVGGLVLAGRAQVGTSLGSDALIVSERFELGGATTVRGYGENSLGPRDEFGLPGGDALLALNAEVRFRVRGWVHGVGFVDAGNVFPTRSDLSFGDLAVGYGVGLRLVSPFALFRVDFGMPATTVPQGRAANQWKSGRWYFGIGHVF